MDSSSPTSDTSLLARIREGDVSAFGELYTQHAQPLWRIAYRYLQSRADAEDAVQSVFVRLWEIRDRWAVRSRIDIYLYGAVRHEALQRLRHERVVARTATEHLDDVAELSSAGPASMPGDDVDDELRSRSIQSALETLPERQKLAVTLRYLHGLGYQDIADVMGIAVSYAHKQVALGEQTLRRVLANL